MVVLTSDRSGLHLETRLDGATGPVRPRGSASEAAVLPALWHEEFEGGFAYPNVRVEIDGDSGTASVTIVGPPNHECFAPEPGPRRLRTRWWPLAVCREFGDALLQLRRQEPKVRAIVLRTEGDPLAVASADVALTSGYEHDWFVREVVLYWKRTLRRLDAAEPPVTAVIEPGSCFVGTLLELAFAADRIVVVDGAPPAELFLTGMNFGPLPATNGRSRLESRFPGRSDHVAALARRVGDPIGPAEAADLGLLTDQASGTSR
jgi:benzoyl-CoA-dihydrodiol lyase